jgi:hypothetical protein
MDQNLITTTNHEEIKNWIISHKGHPQVIDHEDATGDKLGLRINFPGHHDESYGVGHDSHAVDWDRFFQVFEDQKLAFEYDENEKFESVIQNFRFIKRG